MLKHFEYFPLCFTNLILWAFDELKVQKEVFISFVAILLPLFLPHLAGLEEVKKLVYNTKKVLFFKRLQYMQQP